MRILPVVVPVALGAIALAAAGGTQSGCSSQSGAGDAAIDQTGLMPGPDGAEGDDGGDAGPTLTTSMRLANMSPDLGPVDFCWRVAGSGAFTGPVLGGTLDGGTSPGPGTDAGGGDATDEGPSDGGVLDGATDAESEAASGGDASSDAGIDAATDASSVDAGAESDAGAPEQVAFGQVSALERLPAAGTLDIALVPPYQLSCATVKATGQVTLDPGKTATVTVMGLQSADGGSDSALRIKAFTDEIGDPQLALVRVVHAALGAAGDAPAPPLTFQIGTTVVAPDVEPASVPAASSTSAIDTLGYATVAPLTSPAPIELFSWTDAGVDGSAPAGHTWTTPFFVEGIATGTSHTAFVVSLGSGALGVAWCADALPNSPTGACVLEPAR